MTLILNQTECNLISSGDSLYNLGFFCEFFIYNHFRNILGQSFCETLLTSCTLLSSFPNKNTNLPKAIDSS